MDITLNELEQAINYWRQMRPARGEECALSPEVDALASVYALMIYHRQATQPADELPDTARRLLAEWRRQAGAESGSGTSAASAAATGTGPSPR